jgi:hypothetical protein
MIATSATLKLAGFLMAHALWVMSELPEGQLYVPSALCETSTGERELVVFEANTQVDAIERGKVFLSSPPDRFIRCAFARDGQVNTSSGYVDILNVTMWERPKGEVAIVTQPYRPPFKGSFALLGSEVLIIDGQIALSTQYLNERFDIHAGAAEHGGAAEKWRLWDSKREPSDPLEATSRKN